MWKAVHKALERDVVDGVREYRAMELARLDALQHACWDRAMDGDARSVQVVLEIIDLRIGLLGLDRNAEEIDKPPVLVIGSTPEQYRAGLQRIIDGV